MFSFKQDLALAPHGKGHIVRVCIYPGTFDPITIGHLDIIQRGARLFDKVIVGVASSSSKGPLFNVNERVGLVEAQLVKLRKKGLNLEVRSFDTLLMEFAVNCQAKAILRGIRAVSDYEYELQMAGMNHQINPNVETVFLTASENMQFVASSLVKEVARLRGDVSSFVPEEVNQALKDRFQITDTIQF